MAQNKDPIILKFIDSSTPETLREQLKAHMPGAPNVDLLHEILHRAIQSDKLASAVLIADVISTVAGNEHQKSPKTWPDIILSFKQHHNFSWATYFAKDIKRRKKKNEKLRNESILHLYNTKKLTLFSAKRYPKVFFTLIKLGAYPREQKFSKSVGGEITLTAAILKSKKLNKSSRLHILEFMLEKNLIQLENYGSKNESLFSLCLKGRLDCLKYLLQTPGVEDVLINGANILQYLGSRAPQAFQYLSVPQLVKLFSKRIKAGGNLEISMNMIPECHNAYMAIKEMCKEFPKESLLKIPGVSAKTIDFFAGTPNSYQDYRGEDSELGHSKMNFSSDTCFDIALLPAEILEMVTVNLGAEDQVRLFAASKSLREMMTEYHWQHMLRSESETLFNQLELDTKTTWFQKAAPRIRASYHWKIGKCAIKKIRTPASPVQLYVRKLDEYWLTSTMGSQIRLWNVNDGSGRVIKLAADPMFVDYFNTSPYAPPELFYRSWKHFGYWINNKLVEHQRQTFGVPDNEYLCANLSSDMLLISSNMIFDIKRQKTVVKKPDIANQFEFVKFNPFTNTIMAHANQKLYILDKDLQKLAETDEIGKTEGHARYTIDIVDEYTVHDRHIGGSSLVDLRTMKPILSIPNKAYYNGAGRAIEIDTMNTGIVWNFKTLGWESAIPLPNRASAEYNDFVCNSKMAVFSTINPYTLVAMVF